MALELWSIDDHTFSRLIRPSSMRSTYWTYFGFPADDQNKILTRRKIICTLCNMAIAYNRNTTNLKVHLRSRHPELNVATQPKLKRVRYVYQPVNEVADDPDEEVVVDAEVVVDGSVTSDFNSELIIDSDDIVKQESMLIEKDTEDVGYKIEYIEGDFKEVHVGDDVQSDFSVEIEEISEVEAEDNKRSVIIENTIDMAFQKIFISSMSTDITDGNDFRKFCSLLNYNFPERREIERKLSKLFENRKANALTSIKSTLSTRKYFSLGFDKWSNINNECFITVSIFFSNQQSPLNASILFTIDALADSDEWTSLFEGLKPELCSAAVTNFDSSEIAYLYELCAKYNIPIMPCFVAIIERTAQLCLAADEIVQLLHAARQCLSTDAARECLLAYETNPPEVHPQFWYSSYKYLEFVCNFCVQSFDDNNEELNQMLNRIRNVLNVLSPLKIVLNTLYTEVKPIASLVQPILQQMIKGYYVPCDDDSVFVSEIKTIVHNEIGSKLGKHRLILLTSFLDPRFQSLIPDEIVQSIKEEVQRIFETLKTSNEKNHHADIKPTTCNTASLLASFLGKPSASNVKNPRQSRLQVEMFGYTVGVEVEMEQCPTEWWQKVGSKLYSNIWKVAALFSCVPAVIGVNRSRLSDRIAFYKKRRLLTGPVKRIDQMVWLYADNCQRV